MVEWVVVGAVVLVVLTALVKGFVDTSRDFGELTERNERNQDDLEALGRSLQVFTEALGKPVVRGRALAARWRARLRKQGGG